MPARTPLELPGRSEKSSAVSSGSLKIKDLRHKVTDKTFIRLATGIPTLAITQTTAILHLNKGSCLG